jgi:hypothetical protein
VSQRGLFGTRRLRYEEIAAVEARESELQLLRIIPLPFTATLQLKFLPLPGPGVRTIVFTSDAVRDPDPNALHREIMKIVKSH